MEEVKNFIVILKQEEDGGFSIHCPALPGCSSQGDDRDEALTMIVDAIRGVLEVIEERREEEPDLEFVLEETPALFAEEVREILEFRAEYGLPLGLPLIVEFAEVPIPAAVSV